VIDLMIYKYDVRFNLAKNP